MPVSSNLNRSDAPPGEGSIRGLCAFPRRSVQSAWIRVQDQEDAYCLLRHFFRKLDARYGGCRTLSVR